MSSPLWSSLHALVDLVPMQDVPDPGPQPPPGRIADYANTIVGWVKWALIVAGVLGILICAGMVIIGRRQRNAMATEGLIGAGWVIAGLAMISSAAGVVGAFL